MSDWLTERERAMIIGRILFNCAYGKISEAAKDIQMFTGLKKEGLIETELHSILNSPINYNLGAAMEMASQQDKSEPECKCAFQDCISSARYTSLDDSKNMIVCVRHAKQCSLVVNTICHKPCANNCNNPAIYRSKKSSPCSWFCKEHAPAGSIDSRITKCSMCLQLMIGHVCKNRSCRSQVIIRQNQCSDSCSSPVSSIVIRSNIPERIGKFVCNEHASIFDTSNGNHNHEVAIRGYAMHKCKCDSVATYLSIVEEKCNWTCSFHKSENSIDMQVYRCKCGLEKIEGRCRTKNCRYQAAEDAKNDPEMTEVEL